MSQSPGAQNPMVMAITSGLGIACTETLGARFDSVYQVQRAPQEPMAFVAFGPPTREEIEACAREVGARLDPETARLGLDIQRDGDVSVLSTPSGRAQYAVFAPGRVILADSREQLDAFVSGARLAEDDPLWPLLPRLEGDGNRAVSSLDYSGKLTGVSSIGLVVETKGSGPSVTSHAKLQFPSPDEAARVMAVVDALASASDGDPMLRELVRVVTPRADGSEIDIDLRAGMDALRANPELEQWFLAHKPQR